MKKSNFFEAAMDAIPHDESGFREASFLAVVDRMFSEAVEVVLECPESHDSTVRVRFDDGSAARICNPAQAAFACHVFATDD